MRRIMLCVLLCAVAASLGESRMSALQAPPVVKVCGLLPKDQVKTLIGGNQVFDMVPPREEALGTYGSSCTYPGVTVQVMSFLQSTIDAARKRGRLESIAKVGDEAYLYENPSGYVELYVKVGPRLLTLQRRVGVDTTAAAVRPGVIALANALVPKLR